MAPFEYSNLNLVKDEIRILILLPGQFQDPLQGQLSHVSLLNPKETPDSRMSLKELQKTLPSHWKVSRTLEDRYIFWSSSSDETSWSHPDSSFDPASYEGYADGMNESYKPRYEALSYVWDSPDDPATMLLTNEVNNNVISCTGSLSITRNLESALRHLRQTSVIRTLWIDAICINQANVMERNAQVPRMRYIYKLAWRTIFWLGPSTNDSELALSTMANLGKQVDFTSDGWIMQSPDAEHPTWCNRGVKLPFSDNTWNAIESLVQRSWFQRLWIVQEAQLSNKFSIMQCGYLKVLWSKIRFAIRCLERKEWLSSPLKRALQSIRTTTDALSKMHSLRVISSCGGRACSDPRDRVYGLMGLLPESFAKEILVDYSIQPVQLYSDVFSLLLRQTQRLQALRYVDFHKSLPNLPSWLPDWANYNYGKFLFSGHASGISAACAEFFPPNRLDAVGVKIDTISAVGGQVPKHPRDFTTFVLHQWAQLPDQSQYVTGEPVIDALILTFTYGLVEDKYRLQQLPTRLELRDRFETIANLSTENDTVLDLNHAKIYIEDTWFFIANGGYFGLSFEKPQIGDIICVLLGLSHPCLLCPSLENPSQFLYMGCCFVPGITSGEAILGPLPPVYLVQVVPDSDGYSTEAFLNTETGERTSKDPRLEILSDDWVEMEVKRTRDDPASSVRFRNKVTGEIVNSDPRLSYEALKVLGVKLETFTMV